MGKDQLATEVRVPAAEASNTRESAGLSSFTPSPARNESIASVSAHHSHSHSRHHTHTHMHNGSTILYIPAHTTSPGISGQVLEALTGNLDGMATGRNSGASKAPPPTGKGRDRIIRRGGKSSGSESDETLNGERAAAAHEQVLTLLKKYAEDGQVHELAEIAREKGIPCHLRKEVWPILLKHHPCVVDKHIAKEFPNEGYENTETSREIPVKRIRGELGRYHRRLRNAPSTRNVTPPSSSSPSGLLSLNASVATPDPALLDQAALDTAVEDAIVAFLEKHGHVEYASGMIYVCTTLADWLFIPPSVEASISGQESLPELNTQGDLLSCCFEQMMYVILWSSPECSTPVEPSDSVATQRISHFLTTFRQLMPELASYFDEEDVASFGKEWVHTWITWWCARELGKAEKGRLWDWYLGFENPRQPLELRDGFGSGAHAGVHGGLLDEPYYPCDWHILICVALLKSCKDAIEELEQSEICTLLSRLPKVDMRLIIEEAKSLRIELHDILEREEEEYAASGDIKSNIPPGGCRG